MCIVCVVLSWSFLNSGLVIIIDLLSRGCYGLGLKYLMKVRYYLKIIGIER